VTSSLARQVFGAIKKARRVRQASKLRLYLLEREKGLEPSTTCLEGRNDKRQEPLASFLSRL